jgi:methylglyoxal synthase/pSer/pThr/pTyr-binding forkhead associated (FHA) protein
MFIWGIMRVKVINAQTQIEVRESNLQDLLTGGECLLGRSPNSGLVIDSSDVSRLHGKFTLEQNQYFFYDLGSANGSLVNGAIAQANQGYALKSGDIIRVGEYVIMLQSVEYAEDLPATVVGDPNATVVGGRSFAAPWEVKPASIVPDVPPQEPVIPTFDDAIGFDVEPKEVIIPEALVEEIVSEEIISEEIVFEEPLSEEIVSEEIVSEAELEEPSDHLDLDVTALVEHEVTISSEIEPTDEAIDSPEPLSEPDPWSSLSYVPTIDSVGSLPQPIADIVEPAVPEIYEPTVAQLDEPTITAPDVSPKVEPIVKSIAEADLTVVQPDDLEVPDEDQSDSTVVQPEDLELLDEDQSSSITEPLIDGEAIAAFTEVDEADEAQEPVALNELEAEENIDAVVNQLFDTDPPTVPGLLQLEEDVQVEEPAIADLDLATQQLADQIAIAAASDVLSEVADPTPSAIELPDILSQKYIVLLVNENQEAGFVQLINAHKTFLSQCQTLTTPTFGEILKQNGFKVSQQTPALLQGGYQSINGLITAGKILAVLFIRDFLTPQATQSNDEALSRSCNVYEVLFASNLPTAEAIIHYLQTKVATAE